MATLIGHSQLASLSGSNLRSNPPIVLQPLSTTNFARNIVKYVAERL
jgi:hypothetical protein